MSITANFETLAESAFLAVCEAYTDLTAIATPRIWHELSATSYRDKGGVLISATVGNHYSAAGNNIMADPMLVELTAVTLKTADPGGTICKNILGALRDMIARSSIVTLLNATDRILVYANGVMITGSAYSQTGSTHHMIGITVEVRMTATELA